MKWNLLLMFVVLAAGTCFAQDKRSRADDYYYGYEYKKAIDTYLLERSEKPLTNEQRLNLADCYFRLEDYNSASVLYVDIFKTNTNMSSHRFNKMLRTLVKTTDRDRVDALLKTKSDVLSSELSENAAFNYELMQGGVGNLDFEIFNVAINSPQSDTSPSFYKKNLLFSSSRSHKTKSTYEPTGESYLDIYTATIGVDGGIKNAEVFSKIPFSPYHKSTPFYSEKLNAIYYILSNTINGELAYDDKWKNALAIGVSDSNNQFRFLLKDLSTSFYYPFYDSKTERLYFAANFEDSFGGTDIYYVTMNNGQVMSAPTNMGPRINSPGNEISPFLFQGDLYFSSDVFYGLGGMDVYKATLLQDGSLSIPVNLGEGINTAKDDFGFIMRESGDGTYLGYLASNRKGGKGGDDIYGFRIQGIPGLKTFVVRGKIIDPNTKLGVPDVKMSVLDANNAILKELSSGASGEFSIEIPWEEAVTITAGKERYSSFFRAFSGKQMEEIQGEPYIIELNLFDDLITVKEERKLLKLNKFYFNKGQSDITAVIATELDKVVKAVQQFPNLKFSVATHTDSRGSNDANLKLSQSRSNAIQDYLMQNGVPLSSFGEVRGYGEEQLTNNCINGAYCLEFLHQQNERSIFVVLAPN